MAADFDITTLLGATSALLRGEDYLAAKAWAMRAYEAGSLSRDDEISQLRQAYVRVLGSEAELREELEKALVIIEDLNERKEHV